MSDGGGAASLIFMGGWMIFSAFYTYLTPFQRDITIKDKYTRVRDGNQVFMVTDNENNQYKVAKNLWRWKFYSTELWNELEEGKTYHTKGYGVRCGFWSLYPNILEAESI